MLYSALLRLSQDSALLRTHSRNKKTNSSGKGTHDSILALHAHLMSQARAAAREHNLLAREHILTLYPKPSTLNPLRAQLMSQARAADLGLSADTAVSDIEFIVNNSGKSVPLPNFIYK